MKTKRLPKLCRHKLRNLAYVWNGSRRVYLGKWGSEEAINAYNLFIHEITNALPVAIENNSDITLLELASAFFKDRQNYYVKDGKQTGQLQRFQAALEYPLKYYGNDPAKSFGPRKMLECRALMEESGRYARKYLNTLMNCIRGVFKFGVQWELIPPESLVALQAVAPLKRGRTIAREAAPVVAVPAEDVDATCAFLDPIVRDMVRLQRLTGMRPGEVCAMRVGDISSSAPNAPMIYTLRSDKTSWRREIGDLKKVPLGPKARGIILSYLLEKEDNPDAYLFNPQDGERMRAIEKRRARKTPITKQTRERDRLSAQKHTRLSDHYDVNSYRRAIQRAAQRAGVKQWAPNQLRHLYATEIRAKYGLEAAQIMLGHANANVTQIYAERDYLKMIEIANNNG